LPVRGFPRALADQVPNNNVTGFAKEMDATVVQQLVEEVTKRTLEALQHQRGDQSMPDTANLSEVDDLPVSWGEVIQPRTVEPSTAEAQRLIKLLTNAPPLQDLRSQVTTIPLYSGVPETPATRRNKVDNGLYQVQHKLEYAMHLLVKSVDGGDVASMIQATAWIRSGWEDIQQQRRGYLAGRQAWRLDKRTDDVKAKLLSKEEEAKIQPTRLKARQQQSTQPQSSSHWQGRQWNRWQPKEDGNQSNSRWQERPRSMSQPRSGKGGKGRKPK
jgi:hypothetical protein